MAEEVNSHFSEKQRQGDKSDKSKNVDNSHANYAVRIYLVYPPLKKKKYKELLQNAFIQPCAKSALMCCMYLSHCALPREGNPWLIYNPDNITEAIKTLVFWFGVVVRSGGQFP